MHLICVLASNIRHVRDHSTSLKIRRMIEQIIIERTAIASEDIIALVDHELKPCTGCGSCYDSGVCRDDLVFNQLYERLISGDGLFIVSAHYAPIPRQALHALGKG